MANQGNRVYVSTATVGTGTITLGAAVTTAFTTFAEAGIADGTVIRSYCIEDGNNFEIGSGTYTAAGTTLTRTTVFLSKIAGVSGTTKITLSGSATVRVIAAAEDIVTTTGDNALTGDLTWTGAAWTAYTPAVTSSSGSYTASGRYKIYGKTVHFAVVVSVTGTGLVLTFSLPTTPAGLGAMAIGRETARTGIPWTGTMTSGVTTVNITNASNSSLTQIGDSITFSGTYETT